MLFTFVSLDGRPNDRRVRDQVLVVVGGRVVVAVRLTTVHQQRRVEHSSVDLKRAGRVRRHATGTAARRYSVRRLRL